MGAVVALDRGAQGLAGDEPHRVIDFAGRLGHQPVDRDHAGVFEPAGHFRLEDELVPRGGVVGGAAL